jgi:dTDP-4-dehydrorhamnose 3,5-epimerase-like enzyme
MDDGHEGAAAQASQAAAAIVAGTDDPNPRAGIGAARVRAPLSVDDCKLLELPVIQNPQGNLTFIEEQRHVPFPIARVYYLYDVPGGAMRGGHAHRELEQLIVAVSGSFDVILDDGSKRRNVTLNRSRIGLYMPTMIWRELVNFSSGSVCMVIASAYYDEGDYYRDYDEFRAATGA